MTSGSRERILVPSRTVAARKATSTDDVHDAVASSHAPRAVYTSPRHIDWL
jgi:hypothetical protein